MIADRLQNPFAISGITTQRVAGPRRQRDVLAQLNGHASLHRWTARPGPSYTRSLMTPRRISLQKTERTIADFGDQWTWHTDNSGYYASIQLLEDILSPLVKLEMLRGARVAEVGCGTGRIAGMLLAAGACEVVAVEPSRAIEVARCNLEKWGSRFRVIAGDGTCLPAEDFDLVLSIGVIHHIPDPTPVLRAMFAATRPGGRSLIWVYGREGNGVYLAFVRIARLITIVLPHRLLQGLCWIVWAIAVTYGGLASRLPFLPLHAYFRNYFSKLTPRKQHLVIYDQLNPTHAVYLRRDEAEGLMRDAGFMEVQSHHRHGYSWTVVGTRSESDEASSRPANPRERS